MVLGGTVTIIDEDSLAIDMERNSTDVDALSPAVAPVKNGTDFDVLSFLSALEKNLTNVGGESAGTDWLFPVLAPTRATSPPRVPWK